MRERHTRALAEITELGLSLARKLHDRVDAAATVEEAQGIALAFHRAARSLRLSIVLEARLSREQRTAEREDVEGAQAARAARVETRKAQMRATLARHVVTETEGDEAADLLDELDERLAEDALYDDFAAEPVETHIRRLRLAIGLPAAPAANDPGQPARPQAAHGRGPPPA